MTKHCRRLFAVAGLCAASGCSPGPTSSPAVENTWPAMGSFATVALPAAAGQRLDSASASVRDTVAEVENELSGFIPRSLVSRLNGASGQPESLPLTPHARAVFQLSHQVHGHSRGAFDPTVGPYMALWGFRSAQAPSARPDASALAAVAERVGWRHVEWRDGRARLAVEGMRLDFGAVAKGYGVDAAFDRLRDEGYPDMMVNIGGNLRCAGSARPGHRAGWVVAVRDPFLPYGEGRLGTLTLTDGRATATSGRYERFIEIAGRRHAHVIDPRSGEPVEGLAQVTVVANTAGEADALSTALFVLGAAEGSAMLRFHPGATALFVPDPSREGEKPRALATAGFLQEFSPDPEWVSRIGPTAP